jgi:hypothetical protein
METKYYTPTIEEFYPELEHEIEIRGEWLSLSFAKNIMAKDPNKKCFEENISENRIRVKCLDEQDIIDLGWKEIGGMYLKEGEGFKRWLVLCDDNKIRIDGEYDDRYFDGAIKNKSELKRIMQMLKIIE